MSVNHTLQDVINDLRVWQAEGTDTKPAEYAHRLGLAEALVKQLLDQLDADTVPLETFPSLFDNQEVGYKLTGQTGIFRLHMVNERCNLVWTKAHVTGDAEGATRGFQINAESLFDLALLTRELSDVVEQAIAEEIRRGQ